MMKIASFLTLAAFLFLAACAGSPQASVETGSGPRFVLDLTPGPYYTTTTGWFIFRVPVYPQAAAWVESTDGRYLGTIFVTGKASSGGWLAAPSKGRPEALPVWSHLEGAKPDAVSAATSAGRTERASSLAAGLPAGDYTVKLEVNRSYDFNAAYARPNAGVNGQPSVVYRAKLSVGQGEAESSFEPIGTGSVDGSDGRLRPGLEGIDTALGLFSKMAVSYRE